MRAGRLAKFLLVLFIVCFWWAGGDTLAERYAPNLVKVQPAYTAAADLWDRIDRVIYLKQAVKASLNQKNYTALRDTSLLLQQAVIAVEDRRFYRHHGVDLEGVARAALVNLQQGEIAEGGSTITQQLVKNLFLTNRRSLPRKAEEMLLAIDMEMRYSKQEILEMYLNTVYFGYGFYGVGDAARGYFGKKPAGLTLAEAALLAGLPNAPSLTSPYVDPTAALRRRAVVLDAMARCGYIGPDLAAQTAAQPLLLADKPPR